MKISSSLYKHGYLVCLILQEMLMGIQFDLTIITLPSICQKINVSYEFIGFVKSLVIIPSTISLLTIGIIHDTYPFLVPYLLISECFILCVTSVIISYTTNLIVFAFSFYLQCASMECLLMGGQWNVLRLFKDKSVGKMQIYHLGYGIGAILGGLICRPFLPSDTSVKSIKLTKYCAKLLNNTSNQTLMPQNALYNSSTITPLNTTSENNFEYAYRIGAVLDLVVLIIFALYHFLMPRPDDVQDYTSKKREPLSRSIDPKHFSPNRPKFGIVMASLLILFYFTYVTGVFTTNPFIMVFATDPCKKYSMSQQSGALLSTVVNAAFLMGRIFSSLTVNLNPLLFLLIHNTINVLALIGLCIFGNDYALSLWIGQSIIRFVNGVNYPGATATFNRYIVVSGSFISLAFVGAAFGTMLGQNIGSIVIDNYPSIYNMYTGLIGMGTLLIVVITVFILGRIYGEREFSKPQKKLKIHVSCRSDNEA